MRVSQQEKARSHARIIASASRLMRERGIDGTSLNDVMRDAKMTHGGFYRHFSNKDDLLSAALDDAFRDVIAILSGRSVLHPAQAQESGGSQSLYLSDEHAAAPGIGCPVAAVGGEVARGSDEMKRRFGAGVRQVIEQLKSSDESVSQSDQEASATRQFAMMAGALMIAKACDPVTARAILAACRDRL